MEDLKTLKKNPLCTMVVKKYHPRNRKVSLFCEHCNNSVIANISDAYVETPCGEAAVKVHFQELTDANRFNKWLEVDIEGSKPPC